MAKLASTPIPPYYAVIFSSIRSQGDNGYAAAATEMLRLAAEQTGFLGAESARDGIGITVSYWTDLEAIRTWRENADHRLVQARASEWYEAYQVRICRVERAYGRERGEDDE